MTSGLDRGYVQVYTGDGKGKTTAAVGLAVRAAGAGLRVFLAQFVKGSESGEVGALDLLGDAVTVSLYGTGCFIRDKPTEDDIRAARSGLEEVRQAVASGDFDVVILDEANTATHLGLLEASELVSLMDAKPANVELVLTGRDADPRVVERADLVTEMREVKHYYARGVRARRGIEK